MKKKLVTMILTSAMTLLLAACGGAESDATPTATVNPTEEVTATPTAEPTATQAPTQAPVEEITDTYAKGTITDTGFESEWMDLRFTTPANAMMATQEELDATMKQNMAMLYGDSAPEVLDYATMSLVTEMTVQYLSGTNVIVQVELLPFLYQTMTEEMYLSTVFQNMSLVIPGYEIIQDESTYTMTLGGEEYTCSGVSISDGNGMTMRQDYIVRKKENRMICLAVAYREENAEEAIALLSMFGSYDSEPIELSEQPADNTVVNLGKLTETGYENEWLGLRFTTPEGAVIVEEMSSLLNVLWGDSMQVQLMVQPVDYEGMTAEECVSAIKDGFGQMSGTQVEYTVEDESGSIEIAGKEYIKLSVCMAAQDVKVNQEYCIRVQDDYMILLAVSYKPDSTVEVSEALNAFAPY